MSFTNPYRQKNYMGEFASDSAANTGISSLGFASGGNPQNGQYYYNTTDHTYRARINGAWGDFGGGGVPGGSNTQLQFNDSNAFGGIDKITWDDTNKYLKFGTLTRILSGGISSLATGPEGATAACGTEMYLHSSGGDYGYPFLKCRSEGVGHGMTALATTDCFFYMRQASGGAGGIRMESFTDSSSLYRPFEFKGHAYGGDSTTSNYYPSTRAVFNLKATKKSGTSDTSLGSEENLLLVSNDDDATWLMKGNGNLFGRGRISIKHTSSGFESSPDCSSGGMTLHQHTSTNPHITLKCNGTTSLYNVYDGDTYGVFRRASGTSYGLSIQGLSSQQVGLFLIGAGGSPDTTTSSAGVGEVNIDGRGASSGTWEDLTDSENLLSIRNRATTKILIKGSGRTYWMGGGIDLRTVGSTANVMVLPNTTTGETAAIRCDGTDVEVYVSGAWKKLAWAP